MEEEKEKVGSDKSKLFKWEGWKKELVWIVIFALIILVAYGYQKETSSCRAIQKTECFMDCQFKEGIKEIQAKYPNIMFQCNTTTRTCMASGIANDLKGSKLIEEMSRINISLTPQ